MRCARQRCRVECEKQVSTASMMPEAPSLATKRIAEAAGAHVLNLRRTVAEGRAGRRKADTVSPSSFEPAIGGNSTLRPSKVKPQAASTGSRFWPGR